VPGTSTKMTVAARPAGSARRARSERMDPV
jgi:hypothetical protein